MSGITNLQTLLANLKPTLASGEFVFITRPKAKYGDGADLKPIAAFEESEGLTLIIPKDRADEAGIRYDEVFRMITLQVHSDLCAVGLTAAMADVLAKRGISANVVAAFYHDHIFIPSSQAERAMKALNELMSSVDP